MAFEKIGNLSLSMPYGSLLNCLGIQPIFHTDYYIPTSFDLSYCLELPCGIQNQGMK